MQPQSGDESLGFADHLLERLVRLLGQGVLHHLHLVELVSAHHAAFVGTVAARLASEAGGVGEVLFRQVLLGEYLVAVEGYQRGLGGGEHEAEAVVGRVRDVIDLVAVLGELTGGHAALLKEHMRREYHLVAVADVGIDEVVKQRPLETRAHAAVQPEAVARELGSARVVDEVQRLAEFHVIFRLEVEVVRLADVAERLICLLAAGDQVVVRQVGKPHQRDGVFGLDVAKLGVGTADLGGDALHLGEQLGRILARLLHLGYLLGGAVLRCLQLVTLGDERAAAFVKLDDLVDILAHVLELLCGAGDDLLRIFLDIANVQHNL